VHRKHEADRPSVRRSSQRQLAVPHVATKCRHLDAGPRLAFGSHDVTGHHPNDETPAEETRAGETPTGRDWRRERIKLQKRSSAKGDRHCRGVVRHRHSSACVVNSGPTTPSFRCTAGADIDAQQWLAEELRRRHDIETTRHPGDSPNSVSVTQSRPPISA
jgi:hypothetical protein